MGDEFEYINVQVSKENKEAVKKLEQKLGMNQSQIIRAGIDKLVIEFLDEVPSSDEFIYIRRKDLYNVIENGVIETIARTTIEIKNLATNILKEKFLIEFRDGIIREIEDKRER